MIPPRVVCRDNFLAEESYLFFCFDFSLIFNIRGRMLVFSEAHLRYCIEQYCLHCHHGRPNQGLDNNMAERLDFDRIGHKMSKKMLQLIVI